MHVPDLLEAVHIVGMDEVFLVTRVDDAAQLADLLPIVYGNGLLERVPFVLIEAIPGCGRPGLQADDSQRS
jgi:hypothetical protein